MSLWRQISRGLRVLTSRTAADRDVADEVAHFLEESEAAALKRGLSPEEARRAARLEVGSGLAIREQIRDGGWEHVVDTVLADLRFGARRLRANPGFAAISVLTLAVAIGASTAIFSAASPVLFEPLPYPHADRVLTIWDTSAAGSRLDVTFGTYRELVERSPSFESMAVMRAWQPTLTGPAEPERLEGQAVSADYFRVLGVTPAIGRGFEPADDRVNGPRVVIVSHGLSTRRFGGDGGIVGRDIALDGLLFTVVGIMPRGFDNVLAPAADIWRPLQYDAALPASQGREWGHHLRMAARLRPDANLARAAAEIDRTARTPVPEFTRPPWASLRSGLIVSRLQDDVTRAVRPALLAVFGAVLLLLAIACVNVANLLLARGEQRRGEFAMRAALGAPRSRLLRQLLTESLLMATLAGAGAIAVAALGVRVLVSLAPAGLPRVEAIQLDRAVFVFALGLTIVVGVLVGLAPAIHAVSRDLHAAVQHGSPRTAGGRRWPRRALVVAEVALALVLLVGAGLLLRSLQQLFAIPPGFDASNVLTLQVQTSGPRFSDDPATHRFFAAALDAVRRVPGVETAAFTSQLPLSGDSDQYGVHFEPAAAPPTDEDQGAFRYAISPDYLSALKIPLLGGRRLDETDAAGAPRAVLISDSLARRRFPGRDPIGQRLRIGPDSGPPFTIVGVVADVKQMSLAASRPDAVYLTTTQWFSADRALWLVVRARGDAAALAPAIRAAVWSVDKDQPIVRAATLDSLLAATAAERRFALVLFEAFGLVALLLAATGIYGVLATDVAARTREIGVRSALGASRSSILAMIMGQGLLLTMAGVAAGLAGAALASSGLVSLLFGVSRLDAATYAAVVATMLLVAAAACWLPARRASRIDPALTLRNE
jgi:putative ABC transport system permease protein